MKPKLTLGDVIREAGAFAEIESRHHEPLIYGTTDGKAIGNYIEQKFRLYLFDRYQFEKGNSAKGIDFPDIKLDVKTTSIRQPQSSCPFTSARQKIFGLGYSIILFVYDKTDDPKTKTANLNFLHTLYVHEDKTGDYQMTKGLRSILEKEGNKDDILAYLFDRNLPIDEIGADKIANEILEHKPEQGFLTVSNALQWRLQYARVIQMVGSEEGIIELRRRDK